MPPSDHNPTAVTVNGIALAGLVAGLLVSVAVPIAGASHAPAKTDSSADSRSVGHAAVAHDTETTSEHNESFDFDFQGVEQCGRGCRLVSAQLTNQMNASAQNVTTRIQIRASETTIWRGTANLGTMRANESVTQTRRIQIGFAELFQIASNDGYVRIRAKVTWATGTETFTTREQVL